MVIPFERNFNGKLFNDVFTTLRPDALQVHRGQVVRVTLLNQDIHCPEIQPFDAEVVWLEKIKLKDISPGFFWTDFGVAKQSAIEGLRKWYGEVMDRDKGDTWFKILYLKKVIPQ